MYKRRRNDAKSPLIRLLPRVSFPSLDLAPLVIAERLALAAEKGLVEEIIRVGEKRVEEKCALVAA